MLAKIITTETINTFASKSGRDLNLDESQSFLELQNFKSEFHGQCVFSKPGFKNMWTGTVWTENSP